MRTLTATIQLRADTAANWQAANPTLKSFEAGIETDSYTTSGTTRLYKCKLGDGSTAWNSLGYANIGQFFAGGGSGSTAWADITGTPTTLAGYGITDGATATSTTTFTNKSGNNSQWTNDSGYAKQSLMIGTATVSPGDAQTYYLGGGSGLTLSSSYALRKIPIIANGTLDSVVLMITGANGTSELASLYVRVNDTTDHLVSSSINYSSITTSNIASYFTGLGIAVSAGDTISFKLVTPTWVTNPSSTVHTVGFKVI